MQHFEHVLVADKLNSLSRATLRLSCMLLSADLQLSPQGQHLASIKNTRDMDVAPSFRDLEHPITESNEGCFKDLSWTFKLHSSLEIFAANEWNAIQGR